MSGRYSSLSRRGWVIIKAVELVAPIEAAFVRYLRDLVRGRGNQRFKENFRGTWNMYTLKREREREWYGSTVWSIGKLRKQLIFPGKARSIGFREMQYDEGANQCGKFTRITMLEGSRSRAVLAEFINVDLAARVIF